MITLDTEEMNRINRNHSEAVNKIASSLENKSIPYLFMKSTSLALQGLPVIPGDIDILTTAQGVRDIQKTLGEKLVKPISYSSTDIFQSHYGKINLNGVEVELIGEFRARHDGDWVCYMPSLKDTVHILLNGRYVPVSSLSHERESYHGLQRGKDTKKISVLEKMFSLEI